MAVALILILVNPKTNLAAFGLMKDLPADYSNIRDLGSQIYTTYLLPFELAAVLLVLGMVGALGLLLCWVGVLVTGPVSMIAMYYLARQLVGDEPELLPAP